MRTLSCRTSPEDLSGWLPRVWEWAASSLQSLTVAFYSSIISIISKKKQHIPFSVFFKLIKNLKTCDFYISSTISIIMLQLKTYGGAGFTNAMGIVEYISFKKRIVNLNRYKDISFWHTASFDKPSVLIQYMQTKVSNKRWSFLILILGIQENCVLWADVTLLHAELVYIAT